MSVQNEPSVGPAPVHDPPATAGVRCGGLSRNQAGIAAAQPAAFGSDLAGESAESPEWFAERLRTSSMFGGFNGAALLGVAGLMTEHQPKRAHKGILWGVYVRRDTRSAGIGRRLVKAVLDEAAGRVEIVHLTVERGNLHARRLYTSLGFVEFGLEKDALKVGGTYYDNILMALDLRGR